MPWAGLQGYAHKIGGEREFRNTLARRVVTESRRHLEEQNPMAQKMNRRDFVAASAAVGLLRGPQVVTRGVRPVVVAAGNGNRSKDKDGVTCVAKAFQMITSGSDVLDALIAGVNIVE